MNHSIYLGISILDISKTLMYEFWYDYTKRNMEIEPNYVTLILIALLFILKLKIFLWILLEMSKDGLSRLTLMETMKDLFE